MTEENKRTLGLSKTIYDLNTKYRIEKKGNKEPLLLIKRHVRI